MKYGVSQLLKCANRLQTKYAADNFGFEDGDPPVKIEPPPFENGDLVELLPRGTKAIYLNVASWEGNDKSYVLPLGRKPHARSYMIHPTKDIKLVQKKIKPEVMEWELPNK